MRYKQGQTGRGKKPLTVLSRVSTDWVSPRAVEMASCVQAEAAFGGFACELACRNERLVCWSPAAETVTCSIPESVPIDITVKLMVCLVHLNILEPLNVSSTGATPAA